MHQDAGESRYSVDDAVFDFVRQPVSGYDVGIATNQNFGFAVEAVTDPTEPEMFHRDDPRKLRRPPLGPGRRVPDRLRPSAGATRYE